jgi:hypothetical protein
MNLERAQMQSGSSKLMLSMFRIYKKRFEDTKRVIRSRKSSDGQYNDQIEK